MRSTVAIICALVFMTTLYMTAADDLQCMCSCCVGEGCDPVDLDMFDIPSCNDDSCKAACPMQYPMQCGTGATVEAMCMGPMSGSHIFNRYTSLAIFIVAFSATFIFRI